LVERIADLSPELRVRFTSPHPKDYPVELLHLMADRPNVCNQIHMPAQSGSTTMLKRMKRGYTREAYLELIDTIHSILPGEGEVALSSDFIAGFCGETEAEHADTVSLLEHVEYEQAFLFAYSMRDKTNAHRTMEDNVPKDIKQRRLQELIDTFRTRVHAKNERVELGKLRLVLVEGAAKRQRTPHSVTWHGRTDQNKRVLFPVETTTATGSSSIDTDSVALVLDEAFAIASSTVVLHEAAAASVQVQYPTTSPPTTTTTTTRTHTHLVPGEYAVVEVTEAKGHTLRGRVLWKTTLANFAQFNATVLSQMDEDTRIRFKEGFSHTTTTTEASEAQTETQEDAATPLIMSAST
jgi:hypothetical protein